MRRLLLFSVAAVLTFVAAPALAAQTVDAFNINIVGANEFYSGSGTGFNDGTGEEGTPWYYYENTDWYNQWFYDDPPDPARYKVITYDITILKQSILFVTRPSYVTVALNWSTLDYPESGPDGPPPLPPLTSQQENDWIVREVIFEGYFSDTGAARIKGMYIIPDYNPEWVSIDIFADTEGVGLIMIGTITHECVPAPGAILLGSIGVGLVGWLRRRRTL